MGLAAHDLNEISRRQIRSTSKTTPSWEDDGAVIDTKTLHAANVGLKIALGNRGHYGSPEQAGR